MTINAMPRLLVWFPTASASRAFWWWLLLIFRLMLLFHEILIIGWNWYLLITLIIFRWWELLFLLYFSVDEKVLKFLRLKIYISFNDGHKSGSLTRSPRHYCCWKQMIGRHWFYRSYKSQNIFDIRLVMQLWCFEFSHLRCWSWHNYIVYSSAAISALRFIR